LAFLSPLTVRRKSPGLEEPGQGLETTGDDGVGALKRDSKCSNSLYPHPVEPAAASLPRRSAREERAELFRMRWKLIAALYQPIAILGTTQRVPINLIHERVP
jgi:hypothetical protein